MLADPASNAARQTIRRWCLALLLITLPAFTAPTAAAEQSGTPAEPRQITWDDLLPEGWVPPSVAVDHFFDAAPPQALSSANAPVVAALNAQRIRLPGYLVPITLDGEKLKEFLMVPYFGACIHVPPPPPNQVVFVRLKEAIAVEDPYGAHWVTGVLSTSLSNTELAQAAYTMDGERIDVFDWDAMFPETSGD